MEQQKICPKCGQRMVIRTAGPGRFAGQAFYGCSGYPGCKTILNIEEDELPHDSSQVITSEAVTTSWVPRTIFAAATAPKLQTKFFQTCGFPQSIVNQIYEGDFERSLVRSAAQWRLDYPTPLDANLPQSLRTILGVAETILTRGTTPLCSPSIENQVARLIPQGCSDSELHSALYDICSSPTSGMAFNQFDSLEEARLNEILCQFLEAHKLRWSIIPQVHLSSINPGVDGQSNQRVDFLMSSIGTGSIVVEVDGIDHRGHSRRDEDRDLALSQASIKVLRVSAQEVMDGSGPGIESLTQILSSVSAYDLGDGQLTLMLRICEFLHQVQVSLLEAIRGGWIEVDTPGTLGVIPPRSLQGTEWLFDLVKLAVQDFCALLAHLGNLYGLPIAPQFEVTVPDEVGSNCAIIIGPVEGKRSSQQLFPSIPLFQVSDLLFPGEIAAPLSSAMPPMIAEPSETDAKWLLYYIFRKEQFWEGQWPAIERALQQKDSVVLLPTGGGKSIAFQLAALLLPGRCVVVDPIISLIDDQIDNLRKVGIDRTVGITGQIQASEEREQILQAFSSGHYLFCYVAPERFQITRFREALRALTAVTPVSLIAIDEAHCVSEWGHDFRTAYLNLGRVSREYCESQGAVPCLMALTGTASKIVLKDVQRELQIQDFDAIITPKSFDRPELHFTVLKCNSTEKMDRIQGVISRLPSDFGISSTTFFRPSGDSSNCGLIFCPHVNGQFGIVSIAERLTRATGIESDFYSGGAPRGFDRSEWEVVRQGTARRFRRNQNTLLTCTKAFGMGIDIPNIRYTIHTGLPDSIESFYQEAGRAGRDRRKAECTIIISNDYPRRSAELLSPATPLHQIATFISGMRWEEQDDIARVLWFHVNAFRGEDVELSDIARVIESLGDLQVRKTVRLTPPGASAASEDKQRQATEKALHHLIILSVVDDYTVDYSSSEFTVTLSGAKQEEIAQALGQYVGSYQSRLGEQALVNALLLLNEDHSVFVKDMCRMLVEFIYNHIERSRRSSLNEMLSAASSAKTGEDLRGRILNHLEHSEYDRGLDEVLSSPVGGLDAIDSFVDGIVSPNEATSLRGAIGRLLESYPDVPGLLLLRSLAEGLSRDSDPIVLCQSMESALVFAHNQYGLDIHTIARASANIIRGAMRKRESAEQLMSAVLSWEGANEDFVRELLKWIPLEIAVIPAIQLTTALVSRTSNLRATIGG